MWCAILSTLWFIIYSALCESVKEECIKSYSNLLLTCAKPFESRPSSNINHCHRLCLVNRPRSQSCQYDFFRSQCDLFETQSPLEDFKTISRSSPSSDEFRRRRRRRTAGTVALRDIRDHSFRSVYDGSNSSCEPTMIPSIGCVFLVPTGNCSIPDEKFNDSPEISGAHSTIDSLFPSFISSFAPVAPTLLPMDTTRPYYSSKSGFHPNFEATQVLPLISDCPPSFAPRFEIVDGIEIIAEGIANFQVQTPEACLQACGTNTLLDGRQIPVICHSAQFERLTARCTLFDVSISPTGNAQYSPNVDVLYFEKICITESAANQCKGALRRVPQYVLVGHASAIVDAPTHGACVQSCITAPMEFGFECRSAVHFYEFAIANCILNVHSARTRPAFFTVERRQKVDYIELNDCQLNAKQKDSPWVEWSECDQESGVRYRRHNRTGYPSKVEQLPCVSVKKFQKQFPQLIHEQETSESGQRFVEIDHAATVRHNLPNFSRQQLVKQILPSFESAQGRSDDLIQGNEIEFFGPPFRHTAFDGLNKN